MDSLSSFHELDWIKYYWIVVYNRTEAVIQATLKPQPNYYDIDRLRHHLQATNLEGQSFSSPKIYPPVSQLDESVYWHRLQLAEAQYHHRRIISCNVRLTA